jgi:organic hydroperoxide reductase OsmC/OhrA
MSPSAHDQHRFESRLVWTGAMKGGTTSYETYCRDCRVDIPGKPSLRGTAAPPFRGDPALHNPEDLLVVSLSMCHFLSYLALCARGGITVVGYEDEAAGTMSRFERGFHFTDVLLRPKVTIAAGSDPEKARALHQKAHDACYIASSVNFPVRHEPVITVMAAV